MAEDIEKHTFRDKLYDADDITMKGVIIINQFPLADVRPVVRGEWIPQDKIFEGIPFECSICGEETKDTVMGKPRFRFCPMCGLPMFGAMMGESDG
jgi:hypothetical protein